MDSNTLPELIDDSSLWQRYADTKDNEEFWLAYEQMKTQAKTIHEIHFQESNSRQLAINHQNLPSLVNPLKFDTKQYQPIAYTVASIIPALSFIYAISELGFFYYRVISFALVIPAIQVGRIANKYRFEIHQKSLQVKKYFSERSDTFNWSEISGIDLVEVDKNKRKRHYAIVIKTVQGHEKSYPYALKPKKHRKFFLELHKRVANIEIIPYL